MYVPSISLNVKPSIVLVMYPAQSILREREREKEIEIEREREKCNVNVNVIAIYLSWIT